MTEKTYFTSRRFDVTSRFVRAGARDIGLANIESTHLRRPFFLGAAAISAGVGGFAFAWGDLLYPREIALMVASAGVLTFAGSRVGVLYFQSKLFGVSAGGTIWSFTTLKDVQRAVRQALQDKQAGGPAEHSDDTDDDDSENADGEADAE